MATKAELEQKLTDLQTALEEKNRLISDQGEALKNAVQGSGNPGPDHEVLLALQADKQALEEQLRTQNEKLKKLGVGEEIEAAVRVKMHQGLSREDAIVCARRQFAHDQVLKTRYPNDTERQEALIHAAALG